MNKVYKATDVGCVRPTNEDCAAVFEPSLYVVADGMGGHAAGEVASHILVRVVREKLEGQADIEEQNLSEAIQRANEAILQTVTERPECQGMGTTATLLHLRDGMAFWAHVGDSRLYWWRQGSLQQITKDHSYVEALVAKGELTKEEARSHPKKNVLTRAVGVDRELCVDAGRFSVQPGDVLLLATDGLMNMVAEQDIADVLAKADGDMARQLIDAALASGGRDNVTVVVVVYMP